MVDTQNRTAQQSEKGIQTAAGDNYLGRLFHALMAGVCVWLVALPTPAAGPRQFITQSQSGQFSVQGPAAARNKIAPPGEPARTNLLALDPPRLTVMCERVKHAILGELQAPDEWRGRIFINLHQPQAPDEPVLVHAQYTLQGWAYWMDVPNEIEPPRLLLALVEVILQEIANRHANERPAEIPPWLAPGMAAHLRTSLGFQFVLQDNTPALSFGSFATVEHAERTVRVERWAEPLRIIRLRLGERLPLAFDELNWPTDAQLEEPPGGLYETSSYFFVISLLRLKGGPACLRGFLEDQAWRHLNWHTGFLQAFKPHFQTLRDVDKWWALQIATLTGRDPSKTYTLKESWQKLEEILVVPVRIRHGTTNAAQNADVPLQTIIGDWPYARQRAILRQKIVQLQALRLRLCRELVNLADDYRKTLEQYIHRREQTAGGDRNALPDSPRLAIREAIRRLDVLDEIRADMKQYGTSPAAETALPELTNAPPPALVVPKKRR